MRSRRLPSWFLLLLAAALGLPSCVPTRSARRATKEQVAATLSAFEQAGLVLGEFPIDGANSVVDGDTIRVKGLDSSMRLLALDTEETFKHADERAAFNSGWESYLKKMRGSSNRPVKLATPLGEEAKEYAQAFFSGADRVRLERDHPGEIRDYYGRYLAYVFVERNGSWVNYNLEAVRAGMSPYFTKYGRSRRFHKEFTEAQAWARERKLGIWDPNKQHAPDYEERLAWWNKRGEQIWEFEQGMAAHANWIALTRWDSLLELERRLGTEVVVLGAVGEIRPGDRGPTVVKLSRTRRSDLALVFFDKDLFLASSVGRSKGEYVTVRGVPQRYRDPRSGYERLQILISLPGQISTSGIQTEEEPKVPEGDEPD